ncbi:MAG: hypothetical protein IE909_07465 [Campylobacterales bacterium]|nr:hypothetical protein [Campylobacterales bacterium]
MWLLFPALLLAEISYKGNIGLGYQSFESKHSNEAFVLMELKKEFDSSQIALKLKAIHDEIDTNKRRIDLNELYYGYYFDDGELYVGKEIKFFGNLESGNIVDIYNLKDLLYDPFAKEEKIGSLGVRGVYFVGDGKLELILKLQEEKRELFGKDSPYNQFGNFNYDKKLDENSHSILALYSSSYEVGKFSGDYTLFINDGFDNHRTYYFDGFSMREKLYQATQYGFFASAIYNDTMFKLEELYTQNEDNSIADYNHIGLGVEHTIYNLLDKSDMRIFVEYFKLYFEKNLSGSDIGEVYDNDIFGGVQLDFNNQNNTTLQLGILNDMKNSEKIYQLELESRVFETYSFKFNIKQLKAGDKNNSFISKLGDTRISTIQFQYNF